MPEEKLININELSKKLGGLSNATIYRHIKLTAGFPQPVKIGAATRFRLSDVEVYILNVATSGAELTR